MSYRRVGYLEQCWYLIKWGLKHGFNFRKERKHERNKHHHRIL